MASNITMFDSEDVYLDKFQQTLLQMTSNASAGALSKFFQKNYRPLYQFLLRLYLSSLSMQHPDRGRVNTRNNDINKNDEYTVKEHKILAEWANLLTDDEPLNQDQSLLFGSHTPTSHSTKPSKSPNVIDLDAAISGNASPNIKSSNTSTAANIHAKVKDGKKKNKNKKHHNDKSDGKKHKHSESQKSFHGFAQFTTAIAMMRSKPATRQQFSAYTDNKKKANHSGNNKKGVSFGNDVKQLKSSDDIKEDYHRNRNNASRRESIWDGVLDVNNIIMVPETPKWRPRFSFQQNQLLQDSLLDSITTTLSPKGYHNKSNKQALSLSDEVGVTSTDAMSLFLPVLCVISNKLSSDKLKNELQTVIVQRVIKDEDIKQHYQFFLHSYKDAAELTKSFKKANKTLMQNKGASSPKTPSYSVSASNSVTDDFSLASPSLSAASISGSNASSSSSNSKHKVMNIVQQAPESAISLFASIFKQNLQSGSEIKLHINSTVKDPINCHAPPLSRIEIRKIIQTNSKPYLVDLYVSNRSDNFEYLSSTVILKKGDDLRRDAAVLHVFRLMNKIWREKGLEFTQVPVNAMTYKCCAMSPEFGIIELIEGCKPLRLISALEDTITIAQQFNLVASAAGSYIGSFVMGVRDRHFDNVLIRDNDCTLFHIDFGFVLGETASVDTSKFAITSDLKKLMGVYWDKFIELSVQAYLALRDKYKYLIKYARMTFEYLTPGDKVEEFIKAQLHIDDMSDDKAAKYIARKLKESPGSARTKFKNVVHQIATYKK